MLKHKKWQHYLWKSIQGRNHGIEFFNPFFFLSNSFCRTLVFQGSGGTCSSCQCPQEGRHWECAASCAGKARAWQMSAVFTILVLWFLLHIPVCNISLIKEEFNISFPLSWCFSLTFPLILQLEVLHSCPYSRKGRKGRKLLKCFILPQWNMEFPALFSGCLG